MIPCPSINLRNEREGGIEVKFSVKDSSVVLLLENYENQFFFSTLKRNSVSLLRVEEIWRSLNATSEHFRGMEAFFEDSFRLDAVLSRIP